MEPFVVSARKYRPQTFNDVVGQQAITETLENAIANNHLAQALLFCGPRGVGKTTCARILAKKINQDGTEREDEDFAFNIFELDAASNNSVDDIRKLTDQVRIPPQVGKYKVYIIDEVHMLSAAAFNAFLKTLEEPPKHAIFILATTEKHKIIPTILSRCQIFDFKRITVADAAAYLKYIAEEQGIEAEEDALHIIAQKADGAMRDALSIFDRVVSFSGKTLTRKSVTENLNVLDYDTYFKTTKLILDHKIPDLLNLLNHTLALGFDGHHFITGLASHFRDLMVCQHPETIPLLEVGENAKKRYLEQAKITSKAFLLKALELANDCDLNYKTSKNQRLLVELTLMKLASIDFDEQKKKIDFIIPANYYPEVESHSALATQIAAEQPQVLQSNQSSSMEVESQKEPQDKIEQPIAAEVNLSNSMEAPVQTQLKSQETKEAQDKVEAPISQPNPIEVEPNKVASTPDTVIAAPTVAKKIVLGNAQKKVSGLSLSSIKAKKEHKNTKAPSPAHDELPHEPFTEEELHEHWHAFVKKLDNRGKKILAANLQADIPKLKEDHVIWIELPNSTMKKEVEREQNLMLNHLKKNLNNYSIQLKIKVNEESAKKFAFTPEEKYEKLKEKNPAIELLRKEFDLDL
ncbi:MAG: DNA polymerase III subunit gamma/tau [Croceitalea sp.]|nr:DNA polymerase III subunit gamma/tau [Croceitalea sp.]